MSKPRPISFVEIKTVTWSKDSHGLFDYESKNVNFNKSKVETSSKIFKEGSEIAVKTDKEVQAGQVISSEGKPMEYLFSVSRDEQKNGDKYSLTVDNQSVEETKNKNLFVIVRSLKDEDGTQKGYGLQLGDILRLGRIEYRIIEFQNHESQISSLLNSSDFTTKSCPFSLAVKDCNGGDIPNKQCRICLMDENDCPEVLVNPCNCKGSSAYVHIKCLQDWISSKLKKKVNPNATCFYWKKLNCEICKVSLPDLVDVERQQLEVTPIYRPENPYILLERVFYDKTKTNSDNSKMMILLSISGESNEIKMGRGHECDLRENDISVSRLHALIKYQDGQFVVYDNNSKFGTLVLLRRDYKIEKKKIALQIGRTVITFSLKHSSVNNVPVFKNPSLMEKLSKSGTPKNSEESPVNKAKIPTTSFADKQSNLNGSFSD